MKISIVTPVFNDVRLERALDSILSQEHDHELETIVVDAGSTDETVDVLERYRDDISVLISEPDDGIYDGMNKGISRATGDVVGILNADDRYSDRLVFRDVLDAFEDPEIGACYGDLVYMDDAGEISRYWNTGRHRRFKWYFGWVPPHPTFFIRKRFYDQYGLFDLDFPVAGDYELMFRMIFKHRVKVHYLDRVMVNMAPGGNATKSVKHIVAGNLELARAWRRNNVWGGFLIPAVRPATRLNQFVRRP